MKLNTVEIDRALETVVPVENETQRILREALMRLENGQKWCKDARDDSAGRHCALGAVDAILGIDCDDTELCAYLAAAARALGAKTSKGPAWSVAEINNRADNFSEVRAMFLKAIELSA